MTNLWQPGTQYNHGDEVAYEGARYRIIQPHRSQGDWTPPVTPALWGRMQEGGHSHQPSQHGGHQYQQQQQHLGGHQQQNPPPSYQQGQHGHGKVKPSKGDGDSSGSEDENGSKKPWKKAALIGGGVLGGGALLGAGAAAAGKPSKGDGDDSGSEDEDGNKKWKKAAMIGGGVLGGAALLGAGVAYYKHREKKEDEKERSALATSGPVSWQLVQGKNIPQEAIAGGRESSGTLYVCRANHNGSTTPGKAGSHLHNGAVIGYGNKEVGVGAYEVLVGDARSVRWVAVKGKLKINDLDARPVDGGKDSDGTRLFIARASIQGATHPGKVGEGFRAAFIPWGGKEQEISSYEVLCYK